MLHLAHLPSPAATAPDQHVHAHHGQDAEEEQHYIVIEDGGIFTNPSSNMKLLRFGMSADVYILDNAIVRKIPCNNTEEDTLPIAREAAVYSILGSHPRIAEFLSLGRTDLVDVKYYPNGDLADFVRDNKNEVDFHQRKWFQQIIEAVVAIHEHDIIHSDLALRQFFLDGNLDVRLGDFNASQYPGHEALGYEKAPHCLPRDYAAPNSVTSDLFALGSTLYELVARKAPYSELYQVELDSVLQPSHHAAIRARVIREKQADREIEALYRKQVFPDVASFWGGDIIMGCWKGTITSAREALERCEAPDIQL